MTKVFSFLLFAAFGLIATSSANPGSWESAGGEVFRYSKNPWFVKNTRAVKYCVEIDAAGFSAAPDVVRAAIGNAVEYWRREFDFSASSSTGLGESTVTRIADQVFVQEDCSPSTDLAFKFGDGTLNAEEKTFLGDFRSYIGVTVRKEYDSRMMKGKGFVFVASDQGPGAYSNPGHLISNAWQYPKLLEFILLHELGHIFGLPHSGTGLMSEVFADQLLHKNMYRAFLALDAPSMFGSPRGVLVCQPFGRFESGFFQVPNANHCLKIQPTATDQFYWDIFTVDSSRAAVLAGHMRLQPSVGALSSLQPAVIVHLTPDQQVFTPAERGLMSFLIGAFFVDMNASGIYRTESSLKPYPVYVQMRPDRLNMLGELNGKLSSLLEYSPPTLFKLLFPPKN